MKIPKSVVQKIILTTLGMLTLTSSHLHLLIPARAASASPSVQLAGMPTDRQPEIYQGTFNDSSANQVLQRLHIVTDPADVVRDFPSLSLHVGGSVYVYRASVVKITDATVTTSYHTWVKTVGDLLTQENIELGSKDIISPALTTPIPATTTLAVSITRVAETNVDILTPIPYTTQNVNDPTMEKGTQATVTAGVNGTLDTTYLVHRENGIETSRTKIGTNVVKQPVTQVVHIGTKVISFGSGTASFYAAAPLTAATQNNIPKGTKLIVTNLANGKSVTVTVDDRIGRSDRIIDLSTDAFAAIGSLSTGLLHVSLVKAE